MHCLRLLFFSRYQKSIEIYEDIARQSLSNNLLKYGVKGHLLNAGICQLCKGDVVAITNALERYQVLISFKNLRLHIENIVISPVTKLFLRVFVLCRIWIQHFQEHANINFWRYIACEISLLNFDDLVNYTLDGIFFQ
jgi:hypothetical protein